MNWAATVSYLVFVDRFPKDFSFICVQRLKLKIPYSNVSDFLVLFWKSNGESKNI